MKIAGTLKHEQSDEMETSTCYMCSANCEVHVKTRVEEGSNEKTVTEVALPDCVRGSAMIEHRESDVRLLNPEMRDSDGEWINATWDDALSTIADRLNEVKEKYGPQSVAFMVANMGIEIEGMRLMMLRAASRAEQGLDFHKDAYLAQLQGREKAMEIGTNGVQLLGGHGFVKEHPVERWYRDLRSISTLSGGLHA